jgi:hypothetical protein
MAAYMKNTAAFVKQIHTVQHFLTEYIQPPLKRKGIPNFKETRIAMLRAETVKELFSILDYIRGNYGMNS